MAEIGRYTAISLRPAELVQVGLIRVSSVISGNLSTKCSSPVAILWRVIRLFDFLTQQFYINMK